MEILIVLLLLAWVNLTMVLVVAGWRTTATIQPEPVQQPVVIYVLSENGDTSRKPTAAGSLNSVQRFTALLRRGVR